MRQSFRDFSILVIDNGSDDETVDFIRSNYPTVSILQNFRNLGFAKANNQGILIAKSEYVLVMNADVVLTENFLEKIVEFADRQPQGAAFGGKILKFSTEAIDSNDQSMRETIKSNIIDSTGLKIFKSRRVVDRGEGEIDSGQYDKTEEVFGVTGACVLYRKSALDDVSINHEFFDQDFVAYKEDIDLSWRLRLYGFTCWYNYQAVCFHHRGFYQSKLSQVIKERKKISKILRIYSLRNHHLMLVKNDDLINLFLASPWFLSRDFIITFGALIFEPFQWSGLVKFFKLLPRTWSKRQIIMRHRKITANQIRSWFN